MSIPRRRFLALGGGVAAAAAGLTACGSNTGRPSEGTSSGGASGGSGGSVPSLTQWYHQYGEDGVEDAVKRYAAAYDQAKISVQWQVGDYEKALGAALLTSKVPDVFEYGNGPTLEMIKSNQVVDMTAVLGDLKSDFADSTLASMTWQDKIYAIPQTIDMQMLYYRTSVLQKAGIQPPQTFEELVAAANKLKTDKMGGFFAGNDSGLGVLGNLMIWSSGLEQVNAAKDGPGFDSDALYSAMTGYRDFRKSGGLLQSASADWFSPDPFVNGEAAMVWTGLWNMPIFTSELKDDFGVVPFPKIGSTGRQAVPIGAYGSCVSAKGTDPEAAKAFSKWLWLDKTDYQTDFSLSYGFHIPARKSLATQAEKLKSGPAADAVRFTNELGHAPDLLWTPATQSAFLAAFSNVVLKGADAASEVGKVADKATTEIKRLAG